MNSAVIDADHFNFSQDKVKPKIAWSLFIGTASLLAGYFIGHALIIRSMTRAMWYGIHPVFSSAPEIDDKHPFVTVEYSDRFYADINHAKFRVGWGPNLSPTNFIIIRHENEGWYLRDSLLTDINWSERLNGEISTKQKNYIVLAIHPTDSFKAAVDAADKCRAMYTSGVVGGILLFQCGYN